MRSTLKRLWREYVSHRFVYNVPQHTVIRAHIKAFLFDAYRANEITPQDYTYLREKAERWNA